MNAERKRMWLKALRESRELSQTEVAKLAGISLKHYQRIEYGQRNPAMPVAKRIADHFHFPMDWFVDAPEPMDALKNCNVIIAQER